MTEPVDVKDEGITGLFNKIAHEIADAAYDFVTGNDGLSGQAATALQDRYDQIEQQIDPNNRRLPSGPS